MKTESLSRMLPAELVGLAKFIQAGMVVLSAKFLSFLGVVLSAAGFAWVMYEPTTIRLAGACCFTMLTIWPLYRLESARRIVQQQDEGSE